MKTGFRTPSPEVIAFKVPAELAEAIREQARNDGRTVSEFLRRRLPRVLRRSRRPSTTPTEQADAASLSGR